MACLAVLLLFGVLAARHVRTVPHAVCVGHALGMVSGDGVLDAALLAALLLRGLVAVPEADRVAAAPGLVLVHVVQRAVVLAQRRRGVPLAVGVGGAAGLVAVAVQALDRAALLRGAPLAHGVLATRRLRRQQRAVLVALLVHVVPHALGVGVARVGRRPAELALLGTRRLGRRLPHARVGVLRAALRLGQHVLAGLAARRRNRVPHARAVGGARRCSQVLDTALLLACRSARLPPAHRVLRTGLVGGVVRAVVLALLVRVVPLALLVRVGLARRRRSVAVVALLDTHGLLRAPLAHGVAKTRARALHALAALAAFEAQHVPLAVGVLLARRAVEVPERALLLALVEVVAPLAHGRVLGALGLQGGGVKRRQLKRVDAGARRVARARGGVPHALHVGRARRLVLVPVAAARGALGGGASRLPDDGRKGLHPRTRGVGAARGLGGHLRAQLAAVARRRVPVAAGTGGAHVLGRALRTLIHALLRRGLPHAQLVGLARGVGRVAQRALLAAAAGAAVLIHVPRAHLRVVRGALLLRAVLVAVLRALLRARRPHAPALGVARRLVEVQDAAAVNARVAVPLAVGVLDALAGPVRGVVHTRRTRRALGHALGLVVGGRGVPLALRVCVASSLVVHVAVHALLAALVGLLEARRNRSRGALGVAAAILLGTQRLVQHAARHPLAVRNQAFVGHVHVPRTHALRVAPVQSRVLAALFAAHVLHNVPLTARRGHARVARSVLENTLLVAHAVRKLAHAVLGTRSLWQHLARLLARRQRSVPHALFVAVARRRVRVRKHAAHLAHGLAHVPLALGVRRARVCLLHELATLAALLVWGVPLAPVVRQARVLVVVVVARVLAHLRGVRRRLRLPLATSVGRARRGGLVQVALLLARAARPVARLVEVARGAVEVLARADALCRRRQRRVLAQGVVRAGRRRRGVLAVAAAARRLRVPHAVAVAAARDLLRVLERALALAVGVLVVAHLGTAPHGVVARCVRTRAQAQRQLRPALDVHLDLLRGKRHVARALHGLDHLVRGVQHLERHAVELRRGQAEAEGTRRARVQQRDAGGELGGLRGVAHTDGVRDVAVVVLRRLCEESRQGAGTRRDAVRAQRRQLSLAVVEHGAHRRVLAPHARVLLRRASRVVLEVVALAVAHVRVGVPHAAGVPHAPVLVRRLVVLGLARVHARCRRCRRVPLAQVEGVALGVAVEAAALLAAHLLDSVVLALRVVVALRRVRVAVLALLRALAGRVPHAHGVLLAVVLRRHAVATLPALTALNVPLAVRVRALATAGLVEAAVLARHDAPGVRGVPVAHQVPGARRLVRVAAARLRARGARRRPLAAGGVALAGGLGHVAVLADLLARRLARGVHLAHASHVLGTHGHVRDLAAATHARLVLDGRHALRLGRALERVGVGVLDGAQTALDHALAAVTAVQGTETERVRRTHSRQLQIALVGALLARLVPHAQTVRVALMLRCVLAVRAARLALAGGAVAAAGRRLEPVAVRVRRAVAHVVQLARDAALRLDGVPRAAARRHVQWVRAVLGRLVGRARAQTRAGAVKLQDDLAGLHVRRLVQHVHRQFRAGARKHHVLLCDAKVGLAVQRGERCPIQLGTGVAVQCLLTAALSHLVLVVPRALAALVAHVYGDDEVVVALHADNLLAVLLDRALAVLREVDGDALLLRRHGDVHDVLAAGEPLAAVGVRHLDAVRRRVGLAHALAAHTRLPVPAALLVDVAVPGRGVLVGALGRAVLAHGVPVARRPRRAVRFRRVEVALGVAHRRSGLPLTRRVRDAAVLRVVRAARLAALGRVAPLAVAVRFAPSRVGVQTVLVDAGGVLHGPLAVIARSARRLVEAAQTALHQTRGLVVLGGEALGVLVAPDVLLVVDVLPTLRLALRRCLVRAPRAAGAHGGALARRLVVLGALLVALAVLGVPVAPLDGVARGLVALDLVAALDAHVVARVPVAARVAGAARLRRVLDAALQLALVRVVGVHDAVLVALALRRRRVRLAQGTLAAGAVRLALQGTVVRVHERLAQGLRDVAARRALALAQRRPPLAVPVLGAATRVVEEALPDVALRGVGVGVPLAVVVAGGLGRARGLRRLATAAFHALGLRHRARGQRQPRARRALAPGLFLAQASAHAALGAVLVPRAREVGDTCRVVGGNAQLPHTHIGLPLARGVATACRGIAGVHARRVLAHALLDGVVVRRVARRAAVHKLAVVALHASELQLLGHLLAVQLGARVHVVYARLGLVRVPRAHGVGLAHALVKAVARGVARHSGDGVEGLAERQLRVAEVVQHAGAQLVQRHAQQVVGVGEVHEGLGGHLGARVGVRGGVLSAEHDGERLHLLVHELHAVVVDLGQQVAELLAQQQDQDLLATGCVVVLVHGGVKRATHVCSARRLETVRQQLEVVEQFGTVARQLAARATRGARRRLLLAVADEAEAEAGVRRSHGRRGVGAGQRYARVDPVLEGGDEAVVAVGAAAERLLHDGGLRHGEHDVHGGTLVVAAVHARVRRRPVALVVVLHAVARLLVVAARLLDALRLRGLVAAAVELARRRRLARSLRGVGVRRTLAQLARRRRHVRVVVAERVLVARADAADADALLLLALVRVPHTRVALCLARRLVLVLAVALAAALHRHALARHPLALAGGGLALRLARQALARLEVEVLVPQAQRRLAALHLGRGALRRRRVPLAHVLAASGGVQTHSVPHALEALAVLRYNARRLALVHALGDTALAGGRVVDALGVLLAHVLGRVVARDLVAHVRRHVGVPLAHAALRLARRLRHEREALAVAALLRRLLVCPLALRVALARRRLGVALRARLLLAVLVGAIPRARRLAVALGLSAHRGAVRAHTRTGLGWVVRAGAAHHRLGGVVELAVGAREALEDVRAVHLVAVHVAAPVLVGALLAVRSVPVAHSPRVALVGVAEAGAVRRRRPHLLADELVRLAHSVQHGRAQVVDLDAADVVGGGAAAGRRNVVHAGLALAAHLRQRGGGAHDDTEVRCRAHDGLAGGLLVADGTVRDDDDDGLALAVLGSHRQHLRGLGHAEGQLARRRLEAVRLVPLQVGDELGHAAAETTGRAGAGRRGSGTVRAELHEADAQARRVARRGRHTGARADQRGALGPLVQHLHQGDVAVVVASERGVEGVRAVDEEHNVKGLAVEVAAELARASGGRAIPQTALVLGTITWGRVVAALLHAALAVLPPAVGEHGLAVRRRRAQAAALLLAAHARRRVHVPVARRLAVARGLVGVLGARALFAFVVLPLAQRVLVAHVLLLVGAQLLAAHVDGAQRPRARVVGLAVRLLVVDAVLLAAVVWVRRSVPVALGGGVPEARRLRVVLAVLVAAGGGLQVHVPRAAEIGGAASLGGVAARDFLAVCGDRLRLPAARDVALVLGEVDPPRKRRAGERRGLRETHDLGVRRGTGEVV
eukprot:PhM_4_TR14616/c4_g1_i1/m.84432